MDEAFVQHAQHNIQGRQRSQHQHHLIARRITEHLGRALKAAHHSGGHGQIGFDGRQGLLRLRKRNPLRQVERNGHSGKLPLMRHRKGRKGRNHLCNTEQGHKAFFSRQTHLFKRVSPAQPVRPVFKHHMVLVFILINGRGLTLPKGIAKGRVHVLHGQPVAGQGIAVNLDHGFKPALFNIAVHILEQMIGSHGTLQFAAPRAQILQVVGLQGILVLRARTAPAHHDVLCWLQKNLHARLGDKLASQPPDDSHGVYLAFRQGLQRNKDVTAATAPTIDVARYMLHGRICLDDIYQLAQFCLRSLTRRALVSADAPHDDACILLREKSFWHNNIHPYIGGNHHQQRAYGQARMAQHHRQGVGITALHTREQPPPKIPHAGQQPPPQAHNPPRIQAGSLRGGSVLMRHGPQEYGAHHGCGGERNNHGNQHRRGEHHRKLAEQSPHQPAHEQYGRKHRHQRNGNGHNGKAHLARAAQGSTHGGFAHFEAAHNIFEHHNGIVHHKTGGNSQCHERKVIKAVSAQVHDAKGRQQRNGSRHSRNGRGPAVAQKQKCYQHYQRHGKRQTFFHLAQRGADGQRTVEPLPQVGALWQPRAQLRQHFLNLIDCFNNIGPRRTKHNKQHRRFAVRNSHGAHIFRAVQDICHIREAYDFVCPAGNNKRFVVISLAQLVACTNQPVLPAVVHLPLGHKGIGRSQGRAHVAHGQTSPVEGVGDDVHAHGGQCAAAHNHLAHARQLRNFLCQHGRGRIVQLGAGQHI